MRTSIDAERGSESSRKSDWWTASCSNSRHLWTPNGEMASLCFRLMCHPPALGRFEIRSTLSLVSLPHTLVQVTPSADGREKVGYATSTTWGDQDNLDAKGRLCGHCECLRSASK